MRNAELQARVSALTPKMHHDDYVHDPEQWQEFIDACQDAEDFDDLAPEHQAFIERVEALRVPRTYTPQDHHPPLGELIEQMTGSNPNNPNNGAEDGDNSNTGKEGN